MRATWKGNVTFGLVTMPVKLFGTTESKSVSFRQLDADDHSPVSRLQWNRVLDREVASENIVKGYAHADGVYIIVGEDDLAGLPVPSKKTIAIEQFAEADDIGREFHEGAYHIEPGEGGERAYALLLHALAAKDLVGVGKITLRSRERMCIVRAQGGRIHVDTLYYPDEVRTRGLAAPELPAVGAEERGMAEQLVAMMTKPLDLGSYHDEYREALMEVISAKIEGREIAPAKVIAEAPASVDVLAQLRASVEAAAQAAGAATDADTATDADAA